MTRVLLTGAGGFLGRHLIDALGPGHEVIAADRRQGNGAWTVVEAAEDLPRIVAEQRPEVVVHAAFVNRKPPQWSEQTYLSDLVEVNVPLLAACARLRTRLILVSSSAVYGHAQGHEIIDESCSRQPVSLYGVAKATQEMLAEYHAHLSRLELCIIRMFNLCGPGQQRGMLIPDWVSQVTAIARGAPPVLRVTTLKTNRDFVDVRDAARAIVLAVEQFRGQEVVNVASGRAVSLVQLCELLRELCPVPFEVQEAAAGPDSTNVQTQRGSHARISQLWGWRPCIGFEASLRDSWQEWLAAAS